MIKRVAIAVAAIVVIVVIAAIVLSRQRVERHRVFEGQKQPAAKAPPGVPPVEQWTQRFSALEAARQWSDLDDLLEEVEKRHPDLYAQWSLAYLHARARLENNDHRGAEQKLQPYLAAGNPFREVALFHQSEIDDARGDQAAASTHRVDLIRAYADSVYRDQAIDDETEYLTSKEDAAALEAFAAKIYASADTQRRRDLQAHVIEILSGANDPAALDRGTALLRGGTGDDPADRVARALDKPELIRRMTAEQQLLMGESMQDHRHFDRAVAFLSLALRSTPQKDDDIRFAIGRSYFGDEKYAQAQETYLSGANTTRDPKWKTTFLWHAARAAQLQNDDAGAERLMTAAIAVPGKTPATLAALTQRLRTRLKQNRIGEAQADLQLLRKAAPADHSVVEASLAYALAMVARGDTVAAVRTLDSVPRKMLNQYDTLEFAFWRARALESRDPRAAFASYLTVLRGTVPTHFAYFARERLDSPALAAKAEAEANARDAQAAAMIAAKNFVQAKQLATDRILLSSRNRAAALQRLASIYEQLPAYRAVLELKTADFPTFPVAKSDRQTLLMAMGLFDDAIDEIPKTYPLRPASSALTQSLALNRGAASRQSIYAVEVLMKSVPSDFVPDLLSPTVRQLLYPRYFYDFIADDSKRFGADPTLVLSIMREESRFNPRAKSEAAARGLLQFIITTAREIGRDVGLVDVSPDDLYDPRVIIRLGARYIATLTKQFGGDHYRAAGAYNAGPNQVALWSRLAAAPGDDFFLSTINFDETKNYVRKVMNSYKRYAEIYGNAGPQGGLRAEP